MFPSAKSSSSSVLRWMSVGKLRWEFLYLRICEPVSRLHTTTVGNYQGVSPATLSTYPKCIGTSYTCHTVMHSNTSGVNYSQSLPELLYERSLQYPTTASPLSSSFSSIEASSAIGVGGVGPTSLDCCYSEDVVVSPKVEHVRCQRRGQT